MKMLYLYRYHPPRGREAEMSGIDTEAIWESGMSIWT